MLSDEAQTGLITTYELHKDQGHITNLIPIHRPLSLFGLTANMKAFEVPEVLPLQKFAGQGKEVTDVMLGVTQKNQSIHDAFDLIEEDSYFAQAATRMLQGSLSVQD